MRWMIFSKNGMLLGAFDRVEDAIAAFFRWPQAASMHRSDVGLER